MSEFMNQSRRYVLDQPWIPRGLLIIFNIADSPSFHPPSSEYLCDPAPPALPLLPLPEDDLLVQQHVGVHPLLTPGMPAGRSGAGQGGHLKRECLLR